MVEDITTFVIGWKSSFTGKRRMGVDDAEVGLEGRIGGEVRETFYGLRVHLLIGLFFVL
jgi:hypothetical protein